MNIPVESSSLEEPAEDKAAYPETTSLTTTDNLVASAKGECVRDISLDDSDVVDAAEACVEPPVEAMPKTEEKAVAETSPEVHQAKVATMTKEVIDHQNNFCGSYAEAEDERPTSATKEEFVTTLQRVASERPVDDDNRGDMVRIPGEPHDTVEESRYTDFENEREKPCELQAEISNEAPAVASAKDEEPPKPVNAKASLYTHGPDGLRVTDYEYTHDETPQITKVEAKDGECTSSGEPTDEEVRKATSLLEEIFTLDAAIATEEAQPTSELPPDPKTGLVPRKPADVSELSPEDQEALQAARAAPVEMGKGDTGLMKLPHAHLSYSMDVNETGEKTAYIAGINVEDNLQGFGLGSRLLGEFMVRCVAEEVDYIRGFAISRSGLRSHLRVFGEATIEFFDNAPQQEESEQLMTETVLPMTPEQALQSLRLIGQAENSRSDENVDPILSIGMKTNVAAYAAAHPEIEPEVEEYRRKAEESKLG